MSTAKELRKEVDRKMEEFKELNIKVKEVIKTPDHEEQLELMLKELGDRRDELVAMAIELSVAELDELEI